MGGSGGSGGVGGVADTVTAAAATVAAATVAAAEASASAAASWFAPFMSGLGLRCLVVLEDVWEADVVAAASAAGFDVLVTTAFRCVGVGGGIGG